MAGGNVKDPKLDGTRGRGALNELTNPNRQGKLNGLGKENKAVIEKPLASVLTNTTAHTTTAAATAAPTTNVTTSTTATATTRTRPASAAVQQTQTHRVIVNRPLSHPTAPSGARISTTRHLQRESSAAASALFRPSQTRLREDEEEDNISRKRRKTPINASRSVVASFLPVNTVEVLAPAGKDPIEITEADVKVAVEGNATVAYSNAETEERETIRLRGPPSPSPEPDEIDYDWTQASPESEARYAKEITDIKASFKDEVDGWDVTLVSEYSEDIFEYMGKLELESMPDPDYMEKQNEIEWTQRATLVDWLVQIHTHYHLLPETLWIAINIVDRFLSKRVVSLVKLQLVGITAMFIAAKYEEIMAPSVDEFVYVTEGGYSREEILKGERIILQTLNFHISAYCSPYSWIRRISKADDYDIQTRTLSKFLMEVCLFDHRFLRAKPSMIGAIAMFTARQMLGGDWNDAFVYYSEYTAEQVSPGCEFILETIASPGFDKLHIHRKYSHKRFLKASSFARNWVVNHWNPEAEATVKPAVPMRKPQDIDMDMDGQ
ncbi:cyclin-like protein [Cantharellus anzutake]|uniref:cyclin-like protein n=1 Tax=Cantharellus anzutake TaxID=1750568 RepID=UPI001905F202|nr:cyclin-like protein [Cantharellus anzutake]KAF8340688.1 cyclin-like protein [Cantharellus anzutake]